MEPTQKRSLEIVFVSCFLCTSHVCLREGWRQKENKGLNVANQKNALRLESWFMNFLILTVFVQRFVWMFNHEVKLKDWNVKKKSTQSMNLKKKLQNQIWNIKNIFHLSFRTWLYCWFVCFTFLARLLLDSSVVLFCLLLNWQNDGWLHLDSTCPKSLFSLF